MVDKDELKSARVIFVMGGPGSGKATQCDRLVSTYGLTHLSTGDLLRTEVALGSDSAYRLRRTMLNSELVPGADVIRLLGNAMRARMMDSPGFLIDGCPRDREQAMSFELMLVPCRVAVFLDVPEDVMLQRLLRRGRRNDKEEIIQKKIKTFRDKTLAVVKHFEKQGKLVQVDGTGTVSEVFSRVRDGLMSFRPTGKQPATSARGKMTSRVMAFKTAVARPQADRKSAQKKAAKKEDSLSSGTSDSARTKRRQGAKTGSSGSSSPASKQHRKQQGKPAQKHKSRGHQNQQRADKHKKDAAKEQSPKRQDKKQQQQQQPHHQARKQLPEQHHQAKKQLPEQHHQAKKQLPEQHHQSKKQREQTPDGQKRQKSPQTKKGHH